MQLMAELITDYFLTSVNRSESSQLESHRAFFEIVKWSFCHTRSRLTSMMSQWVRSDTLQHLPTAVSASGGLLTSLQHVGALK